MLSRIIDLSCGQFRFVVEFKGFKRHSNAVVWARKNIGDVESNFCAMTSPPDVSLVDGSMRIVVIQFKVIFSLDDWCLKYLFHECYHVCSTLHRLFDCFRPQVNPTYEDDNEEFIANYCSYLLYEVVKMGREIDGEVEGGTP